MTLHIQCDEMEVDALHNNIRLELRGVDEDFLDQINVNNLISYFGELSILKQLDIDVVKQFAEDNE